MRRGIPVLPTLLILLITTACTRSITWEDSIEDALALSVRDGKPVLLYFTFHG